MGRTIWEFRMVIEATEQEADQAHDAIARALCPDEEHPGPCQPPWVASRTRLDKLEGAEGVRWEASFDQDRAGQETAGQRRYREEAVITGRIGRALLDQELPRVTVQLPKSLADRAVAAWERDSQQEGTGPPETFEQATVRGWAGTLSLIGLAVTESGRPAGDDDVVVDLTSEEIGAAIEASDHLPPEDG